MCLIISAPIGVSIPDTSIVNGWDNNPDGAGYMFARGGEVVIKKPFFSLKKLRKSLRQDVERYGSISPFVVHFRWATHGRCDKRNTHPHRLDNGMGLVHNGIIDIKTPRDGSKSDTVVFCETVLACRSIGDCLGEQLRNVLGEMIGTGNKLVLLSVDGATSIVNESSGTYEGGIWYSNHSYEWEDVCAKWAPLPKTTGKGNSLPVSNSVSTGKMPDFFKLPNGKFDPELLNEIDPDDLDDDEWALWKEAEQLAEMQSDDAMPDSLDEILANEEKHWNDAQKRVARKF